MTRFSVTLLGFRLRALSKKQNKINLVHKHTECCLRTSSTYSEYITILEKFKFRVDQAVSSASVQNSQSVSIIKKDHGERKHVQSSSREIPVIFFHILNEIEVCRCRRLNFMKISRRESLIRTDRKTDGHTKNRSRFPQLFCERTYRDPSSPPFYFLATPQCSFKQQKIDQR